MQKGLNSDIICSLFGKLTDYDLILRTINAFPENKQLAYNCVKVILSYTIISQKKILLKDKDIENFKKLEVLNVPIEIYNLNTITSLLDLREGIFYLNIEGEPFDLTQSRAILEFVKKLGDRQKEVCFEFRRSDIWTDLMLCKDHLYIFFQSIEIDSFLATRNLELKTYKNIVKNFTINHIWTMIQQVPPYPDFDVVLHMLYPDVFAFVTLLEHNTGYLGYAFHFHTEVKNITENLINNLEQDLKYATDKISNINLNSRIEVFDFPIHPSAFVTDTILSKLPKVKEFTLVYTHIVDEIIEKYPYLKFKLVSFKEEDDPRVKPLKIYKSISEAIKDQL